MGRYSLEALRQQIEEQELDVLVFCELGMEPVNYLLAFSRLAPVQVATHGHASTSGITSSLDYYVTYKCAVGAWSEVYWLQAAHPNPQLNLPAPAAVLSVI